MRTRGVLFLVPGLTFIAAGARFLGSDASRIDLLRYAIGTTLILAGQTFEPTVTRPLPGASGWCAPHRYFR
jgi:hypothetical protein